MHISQLQDKKLLEEHAKSSFNFTFLIKNEWILSVSFIIIGFLIYIIRGVFNVSNFIFFGIGIYELIKFQSRTKNWVKKKEKEEKYNKVISFDFRDEEIRISWDNHKRTYKYSNLKKCLISDTGMVIKFVPYDYYYISNKSFLEISNEEFILFLKSKIGNEKIKYSISSKVNTSHHL